MVKRKPRLELKQERVRVLTEQETHAVVGGTGFNIPKRIDGSCN